MDVVPVIFAGAMLTVIARAVSDTNDFAAFYAAAREWRVGALVPNVGPVDLNPPTFSILLSPLTFLSLHAARVVWTLVSAAALIDSLRQIRRELTLDGRTLLWVACGCVGLQPAVFAWGLGQLTWVLMWIVTNAWLASRRSTMRAGVWLGFGIAIKPPLALMAILLPIVACASAAAVAASITVLAIAIAGWPAWQAWLASSARVDWLAWWPNASLWGTAARIHVGGLAPVALRSLPIASIAVVFVLAAVLAVMALRASGDRRWLLAGLWSLAVSPLGWTYYLPLYIGPALASAIAGRGAFVAAIVILAAPAGMLTILGAHPGWTAATVGSAYTIALACLWIAWRRDA